MWIIFEKSSGWIVYRKKDWKTEILLLKWLNSKKEEEYVIPKWHIEKNEIAKEAAIRETCEEAGFEKKDLEVIKFVTKLNYTFTAWHKPWNPLINKDVYIFLIKYHWDKDPVVQKEERFVWFEWIDINNISKIPVKFDLKWIVSRSRTYFI
jgi:8-oxo-dGTP pyrophosphatase MutT (NUDIX family)